MMKMLIKMDSNKIEHEGKYDLTKIDNYLNEEFSRRGMQKDDDGFYVGGNFSTYGSMIFGLSKADWFIDNVLEWFWYDSDGKSDPEDYAVEDLAAHYRNKRKLAGYK